MNMPKITPFLMFNGQAEEAMNFYVAIFSNSEIKSMKQFGANEAGAEGSVMTASFSLNGHEYMCMDSSVKHEFTFTPSLSLHVSCETEEEIDHVFEKLSQDGNILMPLSACTFSKKFGWTQDKYGVSWQLALV
ncbi:VOC family protein [Metabacillus sp. RGM 3146]|uniref:VOC family protein n=1 Tax=Metabacillus sp. RGM 3146 TaxID=3401092 RepID=UPI003B9D5681